MIQRTVVPPSVAFGWFISVVSSAGWACAGRAGRRVINWVLAEAVFGEPDLWLVDSPFGPALCRPRYGVAVWGPGLDGCPAVDHPWRPM